MEFRFFFFLLFSMVYICVCMCFPCIVARQRLGERSRCNEYVHNNRRIVGRIVFSAVHVISKKNMPLSDPSQVCEAHVRLNRVVNCEHALEYAHFWFN
jgi:hypothetical protein